MFAAFGFETMGVVVGDMFFVDPAPNEGQETPERGVRLELRLVERAEPQGSIYAGVPIAFTRPLWRGDLLGSPQRPAPAPGSGASPPPFRRLATRAPALRRRAVSRSAVLAGRSARRPGHRAGPG